MPYRIDVHHAAADALDRLVELGCIDVEASPHGALAALMPDDVAPDDVARALGGAPVSTSPVAGRDADSVWVLARRPLDVGRLRIVPADSPGGESTVRLIEGAAFGTGLHPTTALCLEALQDIVSLAAPDAVLDVGTGSGVLALAALRLGVPRALGIDVDDEALRVAEENVRINGLDGHLQLMRGGPEQAPGMWPLVLANLLAGPLIEMAPVLVRRVSHAGHLVLSGVPRAVEADVDRAYRRLGMRRMRVMSRGGWVALVLQASW